MGFGIVACIVSGLVHAQSVAGRSEGRASVSATGAARHAVSPTLPPGTNGLARALAIVHDSRGGNGLLGAGFQWADLLSRTAQVAVVVLIDCLRSALP